MRGWSFGLSVLALSCGTIGCSRSGAPAEAAAPAAPAPASEPSYPAVDAPPDVVLWARLASPARDLPVLGAFGVFPEDVAAGLSDPRRSLEALMGPEVAAAVDLDAPVDVLFPDQERKREWTIAYTAHPDPRAKSPDLELVRVGAGRWRIEAPDATSKVFRICELWRGAAPARDRILCSTGGERLAADAPFLIGTAPRYTSSASLRLAIPGPGYRQGLEKVMQETAEEGENPAEVLGTQLVANTVSEHDGIAVDLTFGDEGVEVGFEVAFMGAQAPVNAWLASEPTSAGVLPGFWKLPGDADLALSKSTVDGDELRKTGVPVLAQLLRISSEDFVASDADLDALAQAFHGITPTGGGLSFATGRVRAQGREQGREQGGGPARQDARWYLMALEESGAAYTAAVREFVRQARRQFPYRPEKDPTKHPGTGAGSAGPALTSISLVADSIPGLPEGSLHLLLSERSNTSSASASTASDTPGNTTADPETRVKSDVHVFVVPDEPQVWLSWAADAGTARAQAERVVTASGKDTLREIPALTDSSPRAATGVAFTTLRGLLALATDVPETYTTLPHRGETPIPLWLERRTEPGPGGMVTLRLAGKLRSEVVMDGMAWMLLALSSGEGEP